MRLAIITPVNYLSLSDYGDFYFSLAHVLLESKEKEDSRYQEFFLEKSNSKNTVFLDNGAHEQELVSGEQLLELGNSIQATHIICPDSLGNYEETVELTSKFLEIKSKFDNYNPKFIGVCQAKSWEEFVKLYKSYLENDKIDTIAIPYDLELFSVEELGESTADIKQLEEKVSYRNMKTRIYAMNMLFSQNLLQKNVHLLGWSLPQEIWYQAKVPRNVKCQLSNDSQGYCVYPEEFEFKTEISLMRQFAKLDTKSPTPPDFFRDLKNISEIESFIRRYKKEVNRGAIYE